MSIIHLSVGGPDVEIEVKGKVIVFEDHPRFGPTPINKKTGEVLPGHAGAAFWDAIERWTLGGKVTLRGRAVVPQWCKSCDGLGYIEGEDQMGIFCPACEAKGIEKR